MYSVALKYHKINFNQQLQFPEDLATIAISQETKLVQCWVKCFICVFIVLVFCMNQLLYYLFYATTWTHKQMLRHTCTYTLVIKMRLVMIISGNMDVVQPLFGFYNILCGSAIYNIVICSTITYSYVASQLLLQILIANLNIANLLSVISYYKISYFIKFTIRICHLVAQLIYIQLSSLTKRWPNLIIVNFMSSC